MRASNMYVNLSHALFQMTVDAVFACVDLAGPCIITKGCYRAPLRRTLAW
eukprot:COSAG05_NODE_13268_length_436_cov_0.584570_1_plen_49_part_01